jgi:hypothetical protein
VDNCETGRLANSGRWCRGMKKPKKKTAKSLLETVQDLGQKYGVKVTDMRERGVRAIGLLGGVRKQDHGQDGNPSSPIPGGQPDQ